MKTIEVNITTAIVLSLFIAGIGTILPLVFNFEGQIFVLIYVIAGFAILKTYKSKMWYRINNKEQI